MHLFAAAYVNRGIEHFRANRFDHAVTMFDAALKCDPDDRYARYNRATALLSMGDYDQGFKEYEATWRLFHWRGFGPVKDDIDRLQALPMWRGETGSRLLLYHELGFGDAIMAMRYLPELKRRADLTLVIDPCLARLAGRFSIEVVDKVPADLSGYSHRLPFFGVMGVLGVIPAEPYISRYVWQASHQRIRVGIAWSGRTQTAFTLERFLSMFEHDGFELYALQPSVTVDGVQPLPPCDFADVADRIARMTHVVCVDTAAIHLAGAMGHPSAHLLLPYLSDWRWWHTGRWYPAIKTYRQPQASDWTLPFAQLNEALQTKELADG